MMKQLYCIIESLLIKIKNLTLEDYKVGNNTALLDAVGDTIVKMQENRKITKNNNVLFVIITDGE